MLLHVVGRPAGAGGGMSAVDVGVVLPERQARRLDRLVDRPVALAAERFVGARRDQHLRERAVGGAQLDLLDGGGRVLLRHHEPGAQPRLLADEIFELPLVDGMRERRAIVEIALLEAGAVAGDEHADFDAVGVEVLLLHGLEIGAGRAAAGRERVLAPAAGHHARIDILSRPQALPDVAAEGRHVLAPARFHERRKIGFHALNRMDVAIDDRKLLRGGDVPDRNVHGTASLFFVGAPSWASRRRG